MRQPQTTQQLLQQFARLPRPEQSVKLRFTGIGTRDAYNIAAPFPMMETTVLPARVEERHSENSHVMFFEETEDGVWSPIADAPRLQLQDPFVTPYKDEWIIGGVRTIADPDHPDRIVSWVTEFYKGPSLYDLKLIATGPEHMKDIRLLLLPDDRIAVCTRPQGEIGGRGKIGFMVIDSLAELTPDKINAAAVFHDQFIPEEWGGANELHLLSNGYIGVLGHIACFELGGARRYYSMTFAIDPKDGSHYGMKIVATRSQFAPGPAKRPDLTDVLFSGGIKRIKDGEALLYTGVSDAEAHVIRIKDPFLEYEQL